MCPLLLHTVCTVQPPPSVPDLQNMWAAMPLNPDWSTPVPNLAPAIADAAAMMERLKDNNVHFICHSKN